MKCKRDKTIIKSDDRTRKGDELMENITDRLVKIAVWLMAIVPGIYLLNFMGGMLFHLPSIAYYAALLLIALGYVALLVIAHKIILHISTILHEQSDAAIHHMDAS